MQSLPPPAQRYSQRRMKSALKALQAYEAEYTRTGGQQQFPAVFIWNSIARLQLENGNAEEAIKAYEKGYATVPSSNISELEKKTWLGRLHHGKGRAFAKMGKHEEAWKELAVRRRFRVRWPELRHRGARAR